MNKMTGLGMDFISTKLDGYKTYIGGAGFLALGIAKVLMAAVYWVAYLQPETLPAIEPDSDLAVASFQEGIVSFSLGLGVLGIGHKLEKSTK